MAQIAFQRSQIAPYFLYSIWFPDQFHIIWGAPMAFQCTQMVYIGKWVWAAQSSRNQKKIFVRENKMYYITNNRQTERKNVVISITKKGVNGMNKSMKVIKTIITVTVILVTYEALA